MPRVRGFTLPELVAVIVIVAVLAALALPRLNERGIDASWFQEQVKAALRYAQREAVAQRRLVYVRIGAGSPGQLQLCYDAACSQPLRDIASGAAYVLKVPANVTLSASVSPFSFDGLGQPSAAVALSVSGLPIAVAAETGYVH